jgi:hypothetical protein
MPTSPALRGLCELEITQRRLDYERSLLLLQASRSGESDEEYGHGTGRWLAAGTQRFASTSKATVRVARRIHETFPALGEALRQGRIGWQHCVAFSNAANPRVTAQLGELVDNFIELADLATMDRWAQEVRGAAERLDADGGHDPALDLARNQLHLTPGLDGVTHVSGTLVGELALTIRSLINAEADRVMDRHRADSKAANGGAQADEFDLPSWGQARAEALAELVGRGAATSYENSTPARPEAVVVFDTRTGTLSDDEGNQLSLHLLAGVLAISRIRPLQMDRHGDPLRLGSARRYATPAQRRALLVRDGGCVFSGCTMPAHWCDAHHVEEWNPTSKIHPGSTNIENLALMCRHHHRVTHRPGWSMRRRRSRGPDPDAAVLFEWTTPWGRTVPSQRHQQAA